MSGHGTQTPTPLGETRAFAFPVYTTYPLMLQLGGLLPQLQPGHQVPFYTLEQSEQKFLAQGINGNTKAARLGITVFQLVG